MENDFRFHIPVDLIEKASVNGEKKRFISGICSTNDMDSHDETLLQEGLDFTPFLEGGYFNDNHDKATGGAVGVPSKAILKSLGGDRKGWHVEGTLLDNKRAEEIWDLASALERSESGRKLGFSVQGTILDRDPEDSTQVRKAVVREVAITRCPINHNTELNILAKSLSVGTGPAVVGEAISGSAKPLQPEALECDKKKKKKKKLYTKSEAIVRLCKANKSLSVSGAEALVEYTMRQYPVAQMEETNG